MVGRNLLFFANNTNSSSSSSNGSSNGKLHRVKTNTKSLLFSNYKPLESPKQASAAGTASTGETTASATLLSSSASSESSSLVWSISSSSQESSTEERDTNNYTEIYFEDCVDLMQESYNKEGKENYKEGHDFANFELDPVIEIGTTTVLTEVSKSNKKPTTTTSDATPKAATVRKVATFSQHSRESSPMFINEPFAPPPPPPSRDSTIAVLESASTVSSNSDAFTLLLDLAVSGVSTLTHDEGDSSSSSDDSSISSFTEDDDVEYLLQMIHHVDEWSYDVDENAKKAKKRQQYQQQQHQHTHIHHSHTNNGTAFQKYFDTYIKTLKLQAGNGNRQRTQRVGCCNLLRRRNYYEVVEDDTSFSNNNHNHIMNFVTHIEI